MQVAISQLQAEIRNWKVVHRSRGWSRYILLGPGVPVGGPGTDCFAYGFVYILAHQYNSHVKIFSWSALAGWARKKFSSDARTRCRWPCYIVGYSQCSHPISQQVERWTKLLLCFPLTYFMVYLTTLTVFQIMRSNCKMISEQQIGDDV